MKKKVNSRLMMVASMAIFGTLAPFVRNIPVSSGELALYRAILAVVLIAAFLLVTRQKIPFAEIKKELPGQKAAILSYIDPLVAVVISVTVLGESMTLPQVIGGGLILGFTLWNEITPRERSR